jgi:formylglycine-generating enzyme required for sulfatase activity
MRTFVLLCLLKGPTETESKTPSGCLASLRGFHVSQKPQKASEEEKKKSKQIITRAVTHIRLLEANAGKLSTLDALMSVYLAAYQAARAQAEAEGRMASFKRREPSWTEWRLAS